MPEDPKEPIIEAEVIPSIPTPPPAQEKPLEAKESPAHPILDRVPQATKQPKKFKKDGTPDMRYLNFGVRQPGAGNPPGTQQKHKRTYDPDKLADGLAQTMIEKQSAQGIKPPKDLQVTDADRKMLQRVTGLSVEEFNAKLSDKLANIADKVAQKIEEKLDADEFKTSELGFLFSVMHDKRMSMDGRASLQNASTLVLVNNYGSMSKEDMIAALHGKPKNVTPPA